MHNHKWEEGDALLLLVKPFFFPLKRMLVITIAPCERQLSQETAGHTSMKA